MNTIPYYSEYYTSTKNMVDNSGSESDEAPALNWKNLEELLSAGALEGLRQHLQGSAPEERETVREGSEDETTNPPPPHHGARKLDDKTVNPSRPHDDTSIRNCDSKGVLPPSNLAYNAQDYWDSRFQEEDDYDWLASYGDIAEHVVEAIPKKARVLVVGCGNSSLSADMYDDGYRNLLSTDYSSVVVEKMRARHLSSRPGLQWAQMDMLSLDGVKDGSFEAVIDKAAMDALLVGKGDPWNPDPDTIEQSHRMCTAISRVLVPGGVFVQLSFEQQHFRGKFLLGEHLSTASDVNTDESEEASGRDHEEVVGMGAGGRAGGRGGEYDWDLVVNEIQREGGCFGQFLYLMRKRGGERRGVVASEEGGK